VRNVRSSTRPVCSTTGVGMERLARLKLSRNHKAELDSPTAAFRLVRNPTTKIMNSAGDDVCDVG